MTRATSAQRAVEQLGFDARVVFQPDFNVFAIAVMTIGGGV
jgi:hypothetical protein